MAIARSNRGELFVWGEIGPSNYRAVQKKAENDTFFDLFSINLVSIQARTRHEKFITNLDHATTGYVPSLLANSANKQHLMLLKYEEIIKFRLRFFLLLIKSKRVSVKELFSRTKAASLVAACASGCSVTCEGFAL